MGHNWLMVCSTMLRSVFTSESVPCGLCLQVSLSAAGDCSLSSANPHLPLLRMSAREALSQVDCAKANATGTLRDSCNKDSIHGWTVDLCVKALQEICSTAVSNGTQSDRPSKLEVWGYGGLFVLLVSLSSVVGVFFLPLMKMESYKKVLMGMVGLAVGCLCGSAIFHLIPQAFQLPDETIPNWKPTCSKRSSSSPPSTLSS